MGDYFLFMAGSAGMAISLVHGVLGHRFVLKPIDGLSSSSWRINWAVFQLSTAYWFACGVALVLAPFTLTPIDQARLGTIVAIIYLVGAVANFSASRGRHFGWVALIAVAALAHWAAETQTRPALAMTFCALTLGLAILVRMAASTATFRRKHISFGQLPPRILRDVGLE
jgi:hypothetical protein